MSSNSICENLEPRRLLTTLKPDIAFGTDGLVQVHDSNNSSDIFSNLLATVSGDKIVTAGSFDSGWGVGRFNADGSRDTTFGNHGVFTSSQTENSFASAMLPDGSFIVGVNDEDSNDASDTIRLTHVTANGKLDTTYGTGGVAETELVPQDPIENVRIDFGGQILATPDGKAVVALTIEGNIAVDPFDNESEFVLRFNADGTLDNTFGVNGEVVILTGGQSFAAHAAVDSKNRVLIIASNGELRRLNPDGSPDKTFGKNGLANFDFVTSTFAEEITLQSDDKILVGGQGEDTKRIFGSIRRINGDGSLDTTFGDNGLAVLDPGTAAENTDAIFVDPISGDILAEDGNSIIRLTSDGVPDVASGQTIFTVPSSIEAGPLAVDSQDRILASGAGITRFAARPDVIQGASGRLYVEGTTGADTIGLTKSGSTITLNRNGQTSTYAAANFSIDISADQSGPGDTIDIAVDVPATVTTDEGADQITLGDGDSSITSGDGADKINVGDGDNIINSGGGADTINAGNGQESIVSGGGDNRVTVGNGQLFVHGGTGDDIDVLGSGAKFVYDEGGDNLIESSGGRSKFDLGDGNDTVTALSATKQQEVGTRGGNDNITTGGAPDYIDTGAGNDTVSSNGGDDFVQGRAGDDSILGGSGKDTLIGWSGRDTIKGGPDDDVISGNAPPGIINDAPSRDALYGGGGNDAIYGSPGNDTIFGQDGDDLLSGGRGNDRLVGGAGRDEFSGGAGNDSFDSADGIAEHIILGGTGDNISIAHDMTDVLKDIVG